MAYLDVITLVQAKNHLRVDIGFTEDDEAIERMIVSALQLIELNTNHIMFKQDKTYYRTVDAKRIVMFDYPINDYDTSVTALHYSLRHEYASDSVTLDVGYKTPADVPSPLIDSALMIIDNMYYEHEREASAGQIPEAAKRIMFNYKRCIVS